ncbi:hypothetical protein CC86DRAFT_423112 [Ophiobolus disseminans]|uniref:Uncharacterized protein n=1 Tax=Ophiobolus disseminans TaxID=1469910 RepID=A0A6A6ZQX6_9PLEO|nr:hypothetical protein CC86DRAFT_423112 [Ophiobolus disseminans]
MRQLELSTTSRPQSRITSRITSTPTSPLLRLPAELRNHIYKLVLTSSNVFEDGLRLGVTWYRTTAFLFDCTEKYQSLNHSTTVNQLKYVNKQLYKETAGLELKYNSLVICARDWDEKPAEQLVKWLATFTPSKVAWIKKVVIKAEVLDNPIFTPMPPTIMFPSLTISNCTTTRNLTPRKFADDVVAVAELVHFRRANPTVTIQYMGA